MTSSFLAGHLVAGILLFEVTKCEFFKSECYKESNLYGFDAYDRPKPAVPNTIITVSDAV